MSVEGLTFWFSLSVSISASPFYTMPNGAPSEVNHIWQHPFGCFLRTWRDLISAGCLPKYHFRFTASFWYQETLSMPCKKVQFRLHFKKCFRLSTDPLLGSGNICGLKKNCLSTGLFEVWLWLCLQIVWESISHDAFPLLEIAAPSVRMQSDWVGYDVFSGPKFNRRADTGLQGSDVMPR